MMQFFRKLSLGQKLYGSFGLVLVLALVLGVASLLSMGSMNRNANAVGRGAMPAVGAVDDMTTAANALIRHQREHLTAPAGDKASVAKEIAADATSFQQAVATFGQYAITPADRSELASVRSLFARYLQQTSSFVSISDANKVQQGVAILAHADPTITAIEGNLSKLAASQDARATAADQAVGSAYSSARTTTIIILVVLVLLCAGIAFVITRGIKRAVAPVLDRLGMLVSHCTTDLRKGLGLLAEGDLTFEVTPVTPLIDEIGGDELGQVALAVNEIRDRTVASVEAYNETRATLATLIGQVQASSSTVSSASQQMASTSEETGRAVNEIAQAVSDVATGAERQVRMVEQARHSSQETGEAAEQANAVAQQGVAAAQQATAAMQDLRESTGHVTEAIRTLSEKSEQIGGIVETITGIAGQTNLLALNAAIEAARAGDQGKGFAVVAEEVRKLAEESQAAAANISTLIGEIQDETERTVKVVEASSTKAEESGVTVETARDAFQQIGASVEGIRAQIAQIVEATAEVASVAEQSSASTEQVSASTEETSASAQEIAASAQSLAGTADELNQLVARFKLVA